LPPDIIIEVLYYIKFSQAVNIIVRVFTYHPSYFPKLKIRETLIAILLFLVEL